MINKDKRNAAAGDAWKAMQGNDPMATAPELGVVGKIDKGVQAVSGMAGEAAGEAKEKREQDNANWQAVLGTPEQDEAAMPLHEILAGMEF